MIIAAIIGQRELWPAPEQLILPEQLQLEFSIEAPTISDRVPGGVEPVPPPDAPAALDCVEQVLDHATEVYGIPRPRVRWFRPVPVPVEAESYERVLGFTPYDDWAIWLNVDYRSPNDLARTVAHETVHSWQHAGRGLHLDDMERIDREGEAQRRAKLLVPDGTYRTPRGKKRDAWFSPERRRYRKS